ncbi:response regulator [Pseudomonas sp. Ant30-3]|uniref:response regulator n=1 Tax=Pseudomonas sp. Ant30-3 TaxID=1488328 RepID=UPI00048B4E41|nr:response regulator [Pseudomonas sp. Ant30-3]
MQTKTFRILIADEQHFHRMRIERLFNQLGYYRIAPVRGLDELLTLVEYASEPFDLVLVNGSMTPASMDLPGFFLHNAQVRHAFIYDGEREHLSSIPAGAQDKVVTTRLALPDLRTIETLMSALDPSLPFIGTVISVR